MKIGIDLDGVIFDSETELRVYSEIYEVDELHRNSIKDNTMLMFQDRYMWTKEETDDFINKYHKKALKESKYLPGAQTVLKLLKMQGHELIVITARGIIDDTVIDITKERLKEDGLDIFDKYYYQRKDKEKVCKEEKIDIMIDDYAENCKVMQNEKIKTIYFKSSASPEVEENEYLKTLHNWGEVYRYIKELEK